MLVDFITKLPMSKGHDSILVVCDRFSKMFHFVATTEKTTAEGIYEETGRRFGME